MKVRDLIEALRTEDQNAEVHFAYNYGDHWHTVVAPVVADVEEGFVAPSDYHRMPKVIEFDDDGDLDDSAKPVVLLRA